jgi:hypothetical protein
MWDDDIELLMVRARTILHLQAIWVRRFQDADEFDFSQQVVKKGLANTLMIMRDVCIWTIVDGGLS